MSAPKNTDEELTVGPIEENGDDPLLTAYALGEVSEHELGGRLHGPNGHNALEAVKRTRETAGALHDALAVGAAKPGTPSRGVDREALFRASEKQQRVRRTTVYGGPLLAAAAALGVVLLPPGASGPTVRQTDAHIAPKQNSPALGIVKVAPDDAEAPKHAPATMPAETLQVTEEREAVASRRTRRESEASTKKTGVSSTSRGTEAKRIQSRPVREETWRSQRTTRRRRALPARR